MPGGFEPDDTVDAGPGGAMLPRSGDSAAPCGGVRAERKRSSSSTQRVRVATVRRDC